MSFVSLNVEYFPDPTRGVPVYKGYVYVGEPDTDPEITGNQKTVVLRQSDGTEVSVAQPIRTGAGGVVLYNGSPVQVRVEGNYSLKVLDEQEAKVYYIENATGVPAGVAAVVGQGMLLADLKAFTGLSDGMIAITAGRLAYGDKGGGSWVFDSADLSAKILLDTEEGVYAPPDSDDTGASGSWVRDYQDELNLKWFGTDTEASIALVSAIAIANNGETIYLPADEYIIDPVANSFVIDKSLHFRGDGYSSSFRIKQDVGDYNEIFSNTVSVENITFRHLRFDQSPADNTTADITAGVHGSNQFIINLEVGDLLVEDVYFSPCTGVNTVVTKAGSERTTVKDCRFLFERGASTTPYYDTSAVYSRSFGFIATNNYFTADAIVGTYALAAIEAHASRSLITDNITNNYATLVNLAPTSGLVTGEIAHIVSDNILYNANAGIQTWVNDPDGNGILISNNYIQLKQITWGLTRFVGITYGNTAEGIKNLVITNNIVDAEEELTLRVLVDPINGFGLQDGACFGISVGSTTIAQVLDTVKITGNTVRKFPFVGLAVGLLNDGNIIKNLMVSDNLLVDCGHNTEANSNTYRSFIYIAGVVTDSIVSNNHLVETYATSQSRFQIRANQGTFTRCIYTGNTYSNRAATLVSLVGLSADWSDLETSTIDEATASYTLDSNSGQVQIITVVFAGVRTITLPAVGAGAYLGRKYRFVRTATATGAYALNIDSILSLAVASTWGEVEYTSAGWVTTAKGTL